MIKTLALMAVLLGMFYIPSTANAQHYRGPDKNPLYKACNNLNYSELSDEERAEIQNSAACGADGSNNPISGGQNSVLYRISVIIATIAGAAAVIIIIIGGIGMMTSGGDSQKFSNSRNTLIFAAVGLIVVVLAQSIVMFVVGRVTS